jgi:hypothetical protein
VTKKSIAQILDTAASERISQSLNLTPKILAQIHPEKGKMIQPGKKLANAMLIVIVLMTVLSITTIAYAIYQLTGGDPGLKSIQDAGLQTTLNITAQPTVLPTITPAVKPQEPVKLGFSQNHSGVVLTLDSIYIDESHLELSMRFSTAPPGLELGAPSVTYANVTPVQPRGSTERLNIAAGQAEFISYQVIHASDVNGKLNLSIDVPVLQTSGMQSTPQDNFHFDLRDIPVFQMQQSMPLQQTYAVKVNNITARLESIRISERFTKAVVCYDPLVSGIRSASIQLDGSPRVSNPAITALTALSGTPCVRLTFPFGSSKGEKQLILHVDELSAVQNTSEKWTGPWDFYVDLPNLSDHHGELIATPSSLQQKSQTVGNVIVTLDWVFVDARRVMVGYTIKGLPDVPNATALYGSARLKNTQGEVFGGAGIGSDSIERVEDQPGVLRGTYSVGYAKPLTQAEASFTFEITLDGSQTHDALGYFPYPSQATPYPAGVFPPPLPDRLIGTYHFEFTAPVHPLQTIDALPPQSVGDIEMRVERVEITASLTEVLVCYDKPSTADWWIMKAELKNASGNTDSVRGGSLRYDGNVELPEKSKQNQDWLIPEEIKKDKNGRCVLVNFLLGHGNRSGKVTLTIPDLEISAPEFIPDDQLLAAREKIKEQGIEMDYTTASSGGGGGGGPRFTKLPEGMSQETAYQHFLEALGYIKPGPWVFTFDVEP